MSHLWLPYSLFLFPFFFLWKTAGRNTSKCLEGRGVQISVVPFPSRRRKQKAVVLSVFIFLICLLTQRLSWLFLFSFQCLLLWVLKPRCWTPWWTLLCPLCGRPCGDLCPSSGLLVLLHDNSLFFSFLQSDPRFWPADEWKDARCNADRNRESMSNKQRRAATSAAWVGKPGRKRCGKCKNDFGVKAARLVPVVLSFRCALLTIDALDTPRPTLT